MKTIFLAKETFQHLCDDAEARKLTQDIEAVDFAILLGQIHERPQRQFFLDKMRMPNDRQGGRGGNGGRHNVGYGMGLGSKSV